MKVLLMDLDIINRRKVFPNLALMKLSQFYKAKRDEVYLNFPLCQPDISYASCVFTWNSKRKNSLSPDAIIGGSGIDLRVELPPEIEHIMPDYTLYPNINFSLGFTSRGCIRKCPFCIVPQKEGNIKPTASIYEFWNRNHKKIVLLDNNLLASPNWRETLSDLCRERVGVDFNQGLDIRLIDDEKVHFLKRVKAKTLRFAFDDIAFEAATRRGIELLISNDISPRKLCFYVLVGFNNKKRDDSWERMKILKSYDVDVYPTIYKGNDGKEPRLDVKPSGTLFCHGSPQNLRKFFRIMGRPPS